MNIVTVQKIALGSANCYRIFDNNNIYFLKEFQSGFSKEDLIREANLVNYLNQNSIQTVPFKSTVSGEVFFDYENHLICLQKYIDGITYSYDNFPKKLLLEAAQTLGKIHKTLEGYKLPMGMDEKWIDSFSKEYDTLQYDKLLEELEERKEDENYNKIKKDIIYKKQLISHGNEFKKFYSGITYVATHGDFQGCQLISDEEHIKAVIDFSAARILPATWELMRSYVQSSEYSRATAKIDIDEFSLYVQEYMKYYPLKKIDLLSMPYVYLFQLMRSKYGYSQYLKSGSEDRKSLLQFAFWRTNICREVEDKAERISNELCSVFYD